ncbi:MAG: hypothetical protein CL610_14700 [Anaerolineaceae bacterium]|nr:hypothetical protein [Anaerolineaceae bacterium]
MVSKVQSSPAIATRTTGRSNSALFTRREWLYVGVFILFILMLTALPYVFAYRSAPPDRQFMGIMVNIPDHFQYLSWMREAQTRVLVPNQMTPEDSMPLLFNFLWWTLGRIEALTGLDYATLYQITRLLAGGFVMAATYFFCGVVFRNRTKRWIAFLIGSLGGGLGWIWVIEKYLTGNEIPLDKSFTLFTSEPNTFFNVLAFPHFSIAAGLIAVVFGLVLLGQRSQNLRYAWLAAAVSLLLSVQHAYDMFIIYPVIGLFALFVWMRDRRFPLYLFKLGVIVVLVSMWPALQAFLITTVDPVMRGVLAQFDNAGAFTPAPYYLPFLMGLSWLLAIWALDIRTPLKDRDDTHLFVVAWFLAHFVLVYLPMDFQIHMLSGWQIVAGVLATIGLYTRVLPLLRRFFKNRSQTQLIRISASVLLLAIIPVNLYLFAWRFIDLRRAEAPFYMPTDTIAAYDYLETQVQSDDVVLSSLTVGQFVPALTGARAYLAHWAQTLDFFTKRDNVAAFFGTELTDAQREAILQEFGVDYIIYTPEEQALGDFNLDDAPYLEAVFNSGDATVYAVTLDTVALAASD